MKNSITTVFLSQTKRQVKGFVFVENSCVELAGCETHVSGETYRHIQTGPLKYFFSFRFPQKVTLDVIPRHPSNKNIRLTVEK